MRLYLASTSSRRRDLLMRAGLEFTCVEPGPEPVGDGDPIARALARARSKCAGAHVPAHAPPGVVLGADTVVELDGGELAKPCDRNDARRMLLLLAGREHVVHTAHCVRRHPAGPEGMRERLSTARVQFRMLDFEEIDAYLDTGEWADKAGGYAIQGHAARFGVVIEGEVDTVIGLSVADVRALLAAMRP